MIRALDIDHAAAKTTYDSFRAKLKPGDSARTIRHKFFVAARDLDAIDVSARDALLLRVVEELQTAAHEDWEQAASLYKSSAATTAVVGYGLARFMQPSLEAVGARIYGTLIASSAVSSGCGLAIAVRFHCLSRELTRVAKALADSPV